ncbi:MAG: ABC transporter permease [Bacillota bacterium]|nr:ABC transporter permease [Bacillota bacterium]
MKISDLLPLIWTNMWRRKARTILTMVGVIIGSVSIFVLVSIGSGFQKFVMDKFGSFSDMNTINVYPLETKTVNDGSNTSKIKKGKVLNDNAVKEIRNLPHVKSCVPKISLGTGMGVAEYKKNQMNSQLTGILMKEYGKVHTLLYGKVPSDSSNECIIDKTLAMYVVDQENPNKVTNEQIKSLVNKQISYLITKNNENGEPVSKKYQFKVSGIYDGGLTEALNIKIPMKYAKDILQWETGSSNIISKTGYNSVDIVVDSPNNASKIKDKLKEMKYNYSSFEDAEKSINSVLNGVKVVVGAIGGISLLVAAFGIANTMNMSIYERKKEIGVMKVVGASLWDVKKIFLGEASAIGFLGGVIGLMIGLLTNFIINIFISSFFAKQGSSVSNLIFVDFKLVLFVLVFATGIGFLSGLYPASRASALDVISTIKDE